MNYVCQCCNQIQFFDTPKAAFDAGWDVPPYISITTCNYCPSSYMLLGWIPPEHLKAHEEMAKAQCKPH